MKASTTNTLVFHSVMICFLQLSLFDPNQGWAQSEKDAMVIAKESLAQGKWDSLAAAATNLTRDAKTAFIASDMMALAKYMQGHYNDSLHLKRRIELKGRPADRERSDFYRLLCTEYPRSAHAWVALGSANMQESRVSDAIEAFEKAKEIDEKNPHIYTALGVAERNVGHVERAVVLQLKAIELDGKLAPAYAALGAAYFFQNKLDDAERILREGVKLCPDYAPIWTNLGMVCRRKGSVDAAIECYKKAISLFDGDPLDYLNLGSANAYKGDYDKAREFWEQAIKLDPDGETGASARRNLSRLPR